MGTKIHHGYRLGKKTLPELSAFVQVARRFMGTVCLEQVSTRLAEICADIVDYAIVGTLDERREVAGRYVIDMLKPATPIAMAKGWLRQKMDEAGASALRDPMNDMSCDMSLFVAADGEVYALLHAEQPAFHRAFLSLEGVQEYAYWSGEAPHGITLGEWEARKTTWAQLIPQAVPSESSLGAAKLTFPHCNISPADIAGAAAPVEERAETIARRRALNAVAAEIIVKPDAGQPGAVVDARGENLTGRMIRAVQLATERISEGHQAEEILGEARRLAPYLREAMSIENLCREFTFCTEATSLHGGSGGQVVDLLSARRHGPQTRRTCA